MRAALTGRITSPPIFDVLAVLGKHESLGRLRDQALPSPPVSRAESG
jgi:glutamyl-tRNA synthetase